MSDRIKDAVNSTAANLGGSDVPVRHAISCVLLSFLAVEGEKSFNYWVPE